MTIKDATKLLEALTLICAEIAIHTNEIFKGVVKYFVKDPQKLGALDDTTSNIASLWTSLGIMYSASSNIEYDRKSIAMVELLPEKKQDPEYLVKKAKNIENEFFKFQSALKVIIEVLRFFDKYQKSEKFGSYIDLLSNMDKKIENKTLGEVKAEVSDTIMKYSKKISKGKPLASKPVLGNAGDEPAQTARFGGADYVFEGSLSTRNDSRLVSLKTLRTGKADKHMIEQYILTNYNCSSIEKFIELCNDSEEYKLKAIAISAGLCLDRLVNEKILLEFHEYIVRHATKLNYAETINTQIMMNNINGCIKCEFTFGEKTYKYNSAMKALKGMFEYLRNMDLGVLNRPKPELKKMQIPETSKTSKTSETSKSRDKVFKEIKDLFAKLLDAESEKFFIYGADENIDTTMECIEKMDKFESENAEQINGLETAFLTKVADADKLVSLLQNLESPTVTETCLRRLIPKVLKGANPSDLL